MNSNKVHLLRLVTGTASAILTANESPYWWVAVVPWALFCIAGILATIPLVIVIGLGSGGAQADWMTDEFIIGMVFAAPTFLAISIAFIYRRWSVRQTQAGGSGQKAN